MEIKLIGELYNILLVNKLDEVLFIDHILCYQNFLFK